MALIIIAVSMTLILIVAALVIDLGFRRADRRSDRTVADLAALAAGSYLAGFGGVTVVSNPQEACREAVRSTSVNEPSFAPTNTTACNVFPVDATVCRTASPLPSYAPAVFSSGGFTLTVRYPVSDPELPGQPAVPQDGLACERMSLTFEGARSSFFASILGVDDNPSSATAVVMGRTSEEAEGVAALLLLERETCGGLQTSGQGAVIVKAPSDTNPGVVQADSAGSTSHGCTLNNNANGWVIYGTARPASVGGGPSIVAETSPSGVEGIIGAYAARVGGRAGYIYPTGLSHPVTSAGITSRRPADNRYNPTSDPRLTSFHAGGYGASVLNGAVPNATVITDCNPNAASTVVEPVAPATNLVFDCGTGGYTVGNAKTVTVRNAATVKFVGGVSVNGGTLNVETASTVVLARPTPTANARLVVSGTARFLTAHAVYVGGTPNTCNNVNNCSAVSVTNNGTLHVNTGSTTNSACANRTGPGYTPAGSTTNWTQIATYGGVSDFAGSASLCQTFWYAGRDQASYGPQERTSGGINCSTSLPCHVATTSDARDRFLLQGSIDWSAPNQTNGDPDATNPWEGLALWVEGSGTSNIKGTGSMLTTGVFFLPNATFELLGQAAADNPFNAQFFARSLNFSGQGILYLRPDPRDSVVTPISGTFGLIR